VRVECVENIPIEVYT